MLRTDGTWQRARSIHTNHNTYSCSWAEMNTIYSSLQVCSVIRFFLVASSPQTGLLSQIVRRIAHRTLVSNSRTIPCENVLCGFVVFICQCPCCPNHACGPFFALALGRAKEAAKEAWLFFLEVSFEILVIIQLRGGHLSLFRPWYSRLVGVQAVCDKGMAMKKQVPVRTNKERARVAPYVS